MISRTATPTTSRRGAALCPFFRSWTARQPVWEAGRPLFIWLFALVLVLPGTLGAAEAAQAQSATEDALLRALNAEDGDDFGFSVAISGDYALVGARREDGPNGGLTDAGAAYVFERGNDGTWTQTSVLRASNAGSDDEFGYSVAISGDYALVGAPGDDGPNDGLDAAGAAYVFERSTSGTWGTTDPGGFQTETRLLRASNTEEGDQFGWSVAISGAYALVGAYAEDGPNDGIFLAGAAYVFERSTTGTWGTTDPGGFQTETSRLRASNAGSGDSFGWSVAISGDYALIGAYAEDGPNDGIFLAGAAYVFERSTTGTWGTTDPGGFQTETSRLRASNAGSGDSFGWSVAISGDYALIGAYAEDGPNNGLDAAGAAYVFERSTTGTWGTTDSGGFQTETSRLRASNAGSEDQFGWSVSISDAYAVVGAYLEDGPSDGRTNAGAAYAFARNASGTWGTTNPDGFQTETNRLRTSNADPDDFFGYSVAISGDGALGGAIGDDGPEDGLNNAGAAYVYGPSALPVELAGFTATVRQSSIGEREASGGRSVVLQWSTLTETGNAGFDVQHTSGLAAPASTRGSGGSADEASRVWTSLGFVEGAGTTQALQTYRFETGPLEPGRHAFRLRQVDVDGTEHVLPAIVVQIRPRAALVVTSPAPNPASTAVQVRVATETAGPVTVTAFDVLGRAVATIQRETVPAGQMETMRLATSTWPSGLYVVRIQAGPHVETRRLTVVR